MGQIAAALLNMDLQVLPGSCELLQTDLQQPKSYQQTHHSENSNKLLLIYLYKYILKKQNIVSTQSDSFFNIVTTNLYLCLNCVLMYLILNNHRCRYFRFYKCLQFFKKRIIMNFIYFSSFLATGCIRLANGSSKVLIVSKSRLYDTCLQIKLRFKRYIKELACCNSEKPLNTLLLYVLLLRQK